MKADKMQLKANLQEKTQHGSLEFPIQYYVDELHLFENRSCPLHWHNAAVPLSSFQTQGR